MYPSTRVACTVICTVALSGPAWGAQGTSQQQQQQQTQASQQQTPPPAQSVRLSQLEDDAQPYIGRRITVSGEVEDVLGPRVFKIDERNWADLDGEILVVMQVPLAALVKEDDPVVVTGTLRRYVDVDVDREWGWIDMTPEFEARIRTRPVLVADTLTGTDPDVGMYVSVQPANRTATGQQGQTQQSTQTGQTGASQMGQTGQTGQTGTSGSSAKAKTADMDKRPALTDASELAKATDNRHVGRKVMLATARVDRTEKPGGFWVASGGQQLFVLPSDNNKTVQAGQRVTIEGYVMRLPEQMESILENTSGVGNEEIYVYATSIK